MKEIMKNNIKQVWEFQFLLQKLWLIIKQYNLQTFNQYKCLILITNKLKIELLNKDIENFKKILEQIKLIDNIYNKKNDNIRIELSKIDCFKYLSNEYSIIIIN